MGKITGLKLNKTLSKVDVFLDGSFSFAIDKEVAAETGLQLGQELYVDRVEELGKADLYQRCFKAALHYLTYRPRSEYEVRQRLHQRGFYGDAIDRVIARLKEQKLIDDVAFAQYWMDNRLLYNPRSRQLIKRELRQKGVAIETTEEMTESLDDEANAYEVGLKKARVLDALDYNEFRRRLANYLRRRGFSYEVIERVSTHLWDEKQTASK